MRKRWLVLVLLSVLVLSSLGTAYGHPFQQSPLNLPGTIRGYVYLDSNQNGVMDEGETGLGGVFVTISYGDYSQTYWTGKAPPDGDADANPQASPILPDPKPGPGSYGPTPLQPGYWTVTLHVPDGYRSTTPSELSVLVPEGGAATGVNFGIYGGSEISYAAGTGVAMGGAAGAGFLPQTGGTKESSKGPSVALLVAFIGFLALLGTPWCVSRVSRVRKRWW